MNYRHAFHAGNFCDVLKHAVLAHVLDYMKQKPGGFRVLDVHGGTGAYRLDSSEAVRTGEWQTGIGRLLGPDAFRFSDAAADFLAPYLDVVADMNAGAGCDLGNMPPVVYPGSPLLALSLLRRQDALIANELHPVDAQLLSETLAGDRRVRVVHGDAYAAIKAHLPPPERRGVVLIDPPFESGEDWMRMVEGLQAATRRFATGTTLIWYPRKDLRIVEEFARMAADSVAERLLRVDLDICDSGIPDMLFGNGLLVHNPPWQLDKTLKQILPELVECLKIGPRAGFRVDWLKPAP